MTPISEKTKQFLAWHHSDDIIYALDNPNYFDVNQQELCIWLNETINGAAKEFRK
jgi:hypothetical protein